MCIALRCDTASPQLPSPCACTAVLLLLLLLNQSDSDIQHPPKLLLGPKLNVKRACAIRFDATRLR